MAIFPPQTQLRAAFPVIVQWRAKKLTCNRRDQLQPEVVWQLPAQRRAARNAVSLRFDSVESLRGRSVEDLVLVEIFQFQSDGPTRAEIDFQLRLRKQKLFFVH